MRIGLAAALVAALAVTATGSGGTDRTAALPAKITYVNVGQGDAVVMRIGGKIVVSDTGMQAPWWSATSGKHIGICGSKKKRKKP